MSGKRPIPPSTLVDVRYHSMDEVNQVARATGWQGDYRQLSKGPVTSRWRSLHLGQASVVSHRVDARVYARVAPPQGTVAMAMASQPSAMLIEGAAFGKNQTLVTDAEMDYVTADEIHALTLVVPRLVLEASGRTLFPRMSMNGELAREMKVPPSGWLALQGDFESLLRIGSISSEELSVLLSRFLDMMAGETDSAPREASLGNRSTGRVARRARDYIEDHYGDTIRMEDLCRFAGVSLRTLQRSFAEYFQVSPLEYIKKRRLNAARLDLVADDSPLHTVTEIALDNGFTHLGRFSVNYRELFGESPSETLARRMSSQVTHRTFDL